MLKIKSGEHSRLDIFFDKWIQVLYDGKNTNQEIMLVKLMDKDNILITEQQTNIEDYKDYSSVYAFEQGMYREHAPDFGPWTNVVGNASIPYFLIMMKGGRSGDLSYKLFQGKEIQIEYARILVLEGSQKKMDSIRGRGFIVGVKSLQLYDQQYYCGIEFATYAYETHFFRYKNDNEASGQEAYRFDFTSGVSELIGG
ncbi:hypothetical protein [Candidatus Gromoviella agglomerans]|uniref:hypothetical protein n=1 Tax=Candidatus Gromoviella agglomerans TaxID=2806609 RepID=UPI001E320D21|nr:hypothetical protein [Candidatus Gromoviella agglomerans]UFX98339.1 hypothetical protein Gromo_00230 [Candidatus Gromoviella agglomerans]